MNIRNLTAYSQTVISPAPIIYITFLLHGAGRIVERVLHIFLFIYKRVK